MVWDKRRAAGDAAARLTEDLIGVVSGGTAADWARLLYHAYSTVNEFSEASELERAGKDVAAEFARREAANNFDIGGVEFDTGGAIRHTLSVLGAICDDVKKGSGWETTKALASFAADVASQNMKEPCSLLGGKNLSVTGKWNSLTLEDSEKVKLAKLNTVTTAVGFLQAAAKSYKEGSWAPLASFFGRTTGNLGGQAIGRLIGGAIGSRFGYAGAEIGAGIFGAIGGFLSEKFGEYVTGKVLPRLLDVAKKRVKAFVSDVMDSAAKAWCWVKSWF